MLHMMSALLVLGLVALAVALAGATVARSWGKVVLALAGPVGPVVRRSGPAPRTRVSIRRQPVVLGRQRAWAA